jgi:hypothetical protein
MQEKYIELLPVHGVQYITDGGTIRFVSSVTEVIPAIRNTHLYIGIAILMLVVQHPSWTTSIKTAVSNTAIGQVYIGQNLKLCKMLHELQWYVYSFCTYSARYCPFGLSVLHSLFLLSLKLVFFIILVTSVTFLMKHFLSVSCMASLYGKLWNKATSSKVYSIYFHLIFRKEHVQIEVLHNSLYMQLIDKRQQISHAQFSWSNSFLKHSILNLSCTWTAVHA